MKVTYHNSDSTTTVVEKPSAFDRPVQLTFEDDPDYEVEKFDENGFLIREVANEGYIDG